MCENFHRFVNIFNKLMFFITKVTMYSDIFSPECQVKDVRAFVIHNFCPEIVAYFDIITPAFMGIDTRILKI